MYTQVREQMQEGNPPHESWDVIGNHDSTEKLETFKHSAYAGSSLLWKTGKQLRVETDRLKLRDSGLGRHFVKNSNADERATSGGNP